VRILTTPKWSQWVVPIFMAAITAALVCGELLGFYRHDTVNVSWTAVCLVPAALALSFIHAFATSSEGMFTLRNRAFRARREPKYIVQWVLGVLLVSGVALAPSYYLVAFCAQVMPGTLFPAAGRITGFNWAPTGGHNYCRLGADVVLAKSNESFEVCLKWGVFRRASLSSESFDRMDNIVLSLRKNVLGTTVDSISKVSTD
jgi:hypothetical protein